MSKKLPKENLKKVSGAGAKGVVNADIQSKKNISGKSVFRDEATRGRNTLDSGFGRSANDIRE